MGTKVVKPVFLKNIQIEGRNPPPPPPKQPPNHPQKSFNMKPYLISPSSSLLLPSPTGVAYTSECFPCKAGTFSHAPGSSACEACPRDTFSGHGASSCTPCNTSTHYAGRSSGRAGLHASCFIWCRFATLGLALFFWRRRLLLADSWDGSEEIERENRGPNFSNAAVMTEGENSLEVQRRVLVCEHKTSAAFWCRVSKR